MNNRRFFLASVSIFAFMFAFEWVFHGNLLADFYARTASLWRPKGECILPSMLLGQFMFPFVFSYIFLKGYENKGMGEGIRYGALIWLLFVPSNLIYYAVMPLPFELVLLWLLGSIIEMVLAGAILATIYRPSK